MKLSDLIVDYLNALKHEQGASATTHKQYQSQLRHFHIWLTANGYPEPTEAEFMLPVMRRFLYYLSGKKLRPRTIRSYFHPLRSFGEFMVSNGVIAENPAKAMTLPKKDAAQRQTVSNEEVSQLLQSCERQRNDRRAALCKAVIAILVYGGLRRAELCDLHKEDVNIKEKSILIRNGKGGKSRQVYLPDVAIVAIKEWLALRWQTCQHPYLFAIDRGRRLCYRGLHTLVEDVKAIAGYAGRENIKPHNLRHWRATDLMRAGADLRSVQAFLGHTQLQTTAIYLHTDEEQLRNVADLSALKQNTQPEQKGDKPEQRRSQHQDGKSSRRTRLPR